MSTRQPSTSLQRRHSMKAFAFVVAAFLVLAGGTARAQNITKADNTTKLSTGSSWVGGSVPTASQNALFDSTIQSSSSANDGNGITVKGIIVTNTGTSFDIKGSNTTTIGANGINMTSASNGNNDFTIGVETSLSASQVFNVATGRTLTISGNIDNGNFNLTTKGAGDIILTKALTGSGNLILEDNGGTTTLTATNSVYTGNLIVVNGTAVANGTNGFGSNTITLGNATTLSTDNLALLISSGGKSLSNDITVNNYGNSTTIGGNNSGGTTTFSGNIAVGKAVILDADSGNVKFTGNITGSGNITTIGAGTVYFNGTNNGATGAVNISSGTLNISGGNALGNTSALTISSGANLIIGDSETTGSLAGAGTANLTNGETFTVGGNNQSTTFSGVIQAGNKNSGIDKEGTGTMTLTGANTFIGDITVGGGTLALSDTSGASVGSITNITINTGGTLMLGASNQTSNSAAIALNGGTFAINGKSLGSGGASPGIGALTLSANSSLNLSGGASVVSFSDSSGTTWAAGTVLAIQSWSTSDAITFGSSSSGLTVGQASQIQFINPFGDGKNWSATLLADGSLVPAPEPSTYLAGALLVALAAVSEWRRRSKKAVVS